MARSTYLLLPVSCLHRELCTRLLVHILRNELEFRMKNLASYWNCPYLSYTPSRAASFLGDSIFTSYLINHMPSIFYVLSLVVFLSQNSHNLLLQLFGSVCCVHDHNPRKNIFQAKSVKHIFLGYSRLQKGYRCCVPRTKFNRYDLWDISLFFTKHYKQKSNSTSSASPYTFHTRS